MTPEKAYQQQKANSIRRGIAFELTFDEWWGIWKDWFHLRGRGTNGLCMARENDSGPYAIGNVYITTNLGNALDVDPAKRRHPASPISDDERIEAQQKKNRWSKKPSRLSFNGDIKSHLEYKKSCAHDEFVAD